MLLANNEKCSNGSNPNLTSKTSGSVTYAELNPKYPQQHFCTCAFIAKIAKHVHFVSIPHCLRSLGLLFHLTRVKRCACFNLQTLVFSRSCRLAGSSLHQLAIVVVKTIEAYLTYCVEELTGSTS
uniref:(California timema) hypothetical protein n=1 Tax=Timema californicum TaxID=61474 RepID=A0A7R9JBU0_TIMCA|nr:unnamed protein product [Timema californicum]